MVEYFFSNWEKHQDGEIMLEFAKGWPSGLAGFETLEWRALLQNGVVTPTTEQDISARIESLSVIKGRRGGRCPTFKTSLEPDVPVKLYAFMVGLLLFHAVGRTVSVFEHRLFE